MRFVIIGLLAAGLFVGACNRTDTAAPLATGDPAATPTATGGALEAFREAVRPGGYLVCETFLEAQRAHGWGPTSDDHLLKPGELLQLVEPFEVILAREALDFVSGRPMAVASILALRLGQ